MSLGRWPRFYDHWCEGRDPRLGRCGHDPPARLRCRVCVEARAKGGRYARTGPSTFVHGPNILFDTPEESKLQLERAGIGEIAACFYSHWHPDHTMGRRVWETRTATSAPGRGRRSARSSPTSTCRSRSRPTSARARWDGAPRVHARPRLDPDPRAAATARRRRSAASRCARSGSHEDYVYAFELTDGRTAPARRDGRAQRLVAAA